MSKILITGASGFIGANVCQLLVDKYDIFTVGLTDNDNCKADLAKTVPALEYCDIVLHAAGKAHTVPKTDNEKKVFFDVNLTGTINLCTALEKCGTPESLIFISTVAVYGVDSGEYITETHPLLGNTPYALSKIQAEAYLTEWCHKKNVKLGIIRPALIAGPNPPGNLGSMINGIRKSRYFSIADGKAQKSVLMVADIARLIPALAEKGGIYNVCASRQLAFRELEQLISAQLGVKMPISIPFRIAKFLALFGDYIWENAPINSLTLNKMTTNLTFDNNKARRELNWEPLDVLENFRIE
ncbi:MAG: NAD(P)-dependent oxidoreductase [Lentisphaerota bacterium]